MYYGDGGVGANSILSNTLTTSARSTPEMTLNIHASVLTAPQDLTPTWTVSFRLRLNLQISERVLKGDQNK